jgi:cytochrome c553
MKTILVVLSCIIVLGCGEDGGTSISSATTQRGVGSTRAEPAGVAASASIESHYGVIVLAQDALVLGDVERFSGLLALVADQPLSDGLPPHWRPFSVQLKAAARQGADVDDLDAAARAFAHVVLSCGSCHGALGMGPMGPSYPAHPPAESDAVVEAAMYDHGWAIQRLWEGITGPRNDAWKRGARALATQEVFAGTQPGVDPERELDRRARELRELGEAAGNARSPAERAALYGRLVASCAGCHGLIGVKPEIGS